MGNKDSKPAPAPAPAPAPRATATQSSTVKTIGTLQAQKNNLEKKQQLLEVKIKKCIADALQRKKAGDKQGALLSLKRKQALEKQRAQNAGIIANLEQQIDTLSSSAQTSEILEAQKMARDQLKAHTAKMNVEEADDVALDLQEAQDRINEVNTALAGTALEGLDDYAAELDELTELEAAEEAASMPTVPVSTKPRQTTTTAETSDIPAMPAAPSGPVATTEQKEDDFAELSALMG